MSSRRDEATYPRTRSPPRYSRESEQKRHNRHRSRSPLYLASQNYVRDSSRYNRFSNYRSREEFKSHSSREEKRTTHNEKTEVRSHNTEAKEDSGHRGEVTQKTPNSTGLLLSNASSSNGVKNIRCSKSSPSNSSSSSSCKSGSQTKSKFSSSSKKSSKLLKKEKKEKKKAKKEKKKQRKLAKKLKAKAAKIASTQDKDKCTLQISKSGTPSSQNVPSTTQSGDGCRKLMAPMTKEEWEKRQSVIRREASPTTGRIRLIKGDGEILEEIVSKEKHRNINKQATAADGQSFQNSLRNQKL